MADGEAHLFTPGGGMPIGSITFNGIKYEWLGQSTVRMTADDGFVIYTDPVILDKDAPQAGLILISHHHVDHCLPEFITPIQGPQTKLAAFHESYLKYCVHDLKGVRTIKIGQTVEIAGVKVTGMEAYTQRGFHRKGEGCGFLIEFKGQRVYFSGDTAGIKEMEGLNGVDVAIVSIADNLYSIDTAEMVKAVKSIKPALFIPVHFTPPDEAEPELKGEIYLSKDPRFFTRKEDPEKLAAHFEGTGIRLPVLRKLGRYME